MESRTQNFHEGIDYGNAFGRGYRPSKATAEKSFRAAGGTIGRAKGPNSSYSPDKPKKNVNKLPGTRYHETDLNKPIKGKLARAAVKRAAKKS